MSRTCTKCGCIIMSETDTNCLNCGEVLPQVIKEDKIDKNNKFEKAKRNLIGDMIFFIVVGVLLTIVCLLNTDFLNKTGIAYFIWLVIVLLSVFCILSARNNEKQAGYYSLAITLFFVPEAIFLTGFAVWIVLLCGYHTFKYLKFFDEE